MTLKIKSKSKIRELVETSDPYKSESWSRLDDPVGTLPVEKVEIFRLTSGTAWLRVASPLKKALTANRSVWMGSVGGKFRPAFSIYKSKVVDGTLTFTPNTSDATQYNIVFAPNSDMAVGTDLIIDLVYITQAN